MRNRLSVSPEEAANRIDKLINRGEKLLDEAQTAGTHDSWVEWTHALERWHALGKAAIATTFEGTDEADEFYDAATIGIHRQIGQTNGETFTYQQESIGAALNTLRSLKERLEFAAPPPSVLGKHRAGTAEEASSNASRVTEEDKVFVVHGRNTIARDGMFDFLRAIRLHPIDWSEAVRLTGKGSPYIGEVLDAAFAEARAVVVLMTPDEVAYLRNEYAYRPDERDLQPSGQPRPNVLFEAGMALGRDADRTIMLQLGDLREFSDVAGRHAIRLDGGAADRKEIAARLETAGCRIDLSGEDWKTAGDLTPPPSPDLGAPAAVGATTPQPSDDETLRVTAHHTRTGGAGEGLLTLTNDGSADLLDLRFELPEEAGTSFYVFAELPVTVFPAGARVSFMTARTMGQVSDHFELPITARTADGTQVATKAFVNLAT
jgi:predicted nucleotide-binding protein